MSETTGIEWCDHTFNPWSGCAKVSAGCAHCYAAALPPAMRRGAEWGEQGTRIPASDAYWREPLAWARKAAAAGERRRVFCASTADVFEVRADLDPWRERLWELIRGTPELDWLLLTKRPEVMARWAEANGWPRNAWAGTSVEDPRWEERIHHLLDVAPDQEGMIRFLSMEPLLGHVWIEKYLSKASIGQVQCLLCRGTGLRNRVPGRFGSGLPGDPPCSDCHRGAVGGIGLVIVGGESGRHARPMHPDWARSLRDQCVAAGVPFFFKQVGEWGFAETYRRADGSFDVPDGTRAYYPNRIAEAEQRPTHLRVGKRAAGRLLDGKEHSQYPEVVPGTL